MLDWLLDSDRNLLDNSDRTVKFHPKAAFYFVSTDQHKHHNQNTHILGWFIVAAK